jgi:hypothetical protein
VPRTRDVRVDLALQALSTADQHVSVQAHRHFFDGERRQDRQVAQDIDGRAARLRRNGGPHLVDVLSVDAVDDRGDDRRAKAGQLAGG